MVFLTNKTCLKQISLHKRKCNQINIFSWITCYFLKIKSLRNILKINFHNFVSQTKYFLELNSLWLLKNTHFFFSSKQSARFHVMSGPIWSKSSRMLQTNQEAHMDTHSLDRRLNLFRTVRCRYPRPNHKILLVYTLSGTHCLPAQLTSAPWFSSYCH